MNNVLRQIFKGYDLIAVSNNVALFTDEECNPWILHGLTEWEDVHHPLLQECLRTCLVKSNVPKSMKNVWRLFHYWRNYKFEKSDINVLISEPLSCWAETLWDNQLPYKVAVECGDMCGGGHWFFQHLPAGWNVEQIENHLFYKKDKETI